MASTDLPNITIRFARPEDDVALTELAQLDSTRALTGPVLLAERDDRMLAALALQGGRTVADPFSPTADLTALLELRATALRGRRQRQRRLSHRPALAGG